MSPNLEDVFGQTKVLLVPSVWGEAYGQVVVDAMYEQNEKMQVVPVIPEQDVSVWVETLSRVLTDRALYERVSLESRVLPRAESTRRRKALRD